MVETESGTQYFTAFIFNNAIGCFGAAICSSCGIWNCLLPSSAKRADHHAVVVHVNQFIVLLRETEFPVPLATDTPATPDASRQFANCEYKYH